jgi:site-specific recombinase XerD
LELVTLEVKAGMELAAYVESAEKYIRRSKAENTVRAYRADWEDFTAWCADRGITALPARPETVALYVAAMADQGRKPATIQRRLAAISKAHSAAGP